jgi:thiamine pyrophosphokinase
MTIKRAIVFVNGSCTAVEIGLADLNNNDYFVCVDGGVRHCVAAGFQPKLVVGDMDSINDAHTTKLKDSNTEHLTFRSDKDASDLELTLHHLSTLPIESVVVLGASGGRTDHAFYNWLLIGSHYWPFAMRVIDSTVDAYCVNQSKPLNIFVTGNTVFSVAAVGSAATGVCVHGALYPLDNAVLAVGSTLGLSNETNADKLHVSVEDGTAMVMLVHNADVPS